MTTLRRTIGLMVALAAVRAASAQTPARPADPARTVTLPLTEYNRLLDAANQPSEGPAMAPVAATLAGSDLRIRVDGEAARGVFNVTGSVLRPGIHRVPVLAGATLIDGAMAGRPLPMMAEGNVHSALVLGPGPFALSLEWGTPVSFTPGRASFALPVPPSGTARATIDVPGENAEVRISQGVITRRSSSPGRTVIEATLEPGTSTDVSWSMRDRAPNATVADLRTLADVLTMLTVGESDVRMIALVDLSVLRGEPASVDLRLPSGYELVSLNGNSVDTSTERNGIVTVSLNDPTARRHQFLVALERPHETGSFSMSTELLTLPAVQRERGEIAIEGTGTMELAAADREELHRIDVRELNSGLQALTRQPILSAFRYQTAAGSPPPLTFEVTRFGTVGVPAAIADRATATTLITSEGRALTEVVLTVQNRAQPFLKVTLPRGASMVSVEVAGAPAKPALAADGTRVPLLRQGFRPQGPYLVSFVYLHDGTPFARKGDARMALPALDIPIGVVEWEVFVPDGYSVKVQGGNVIGRAAFPQLAAAMTPVARPGQNSGRVTVARPVTEAVSSTEGVISGRIKDAQGGALPGVTIRVIGSGAAATARAVVATTDANGMFRITGLPPGVYTVHITLTGFTSIRRDNVLVTAGHATTLDGTMVVGDMVETVTVLGEAPVVDVVNARQAVTFDGEAVNAIPERRQQREPIATLPSQNVTSLQSRASGVLPVRVDVPRAGTSYMFVRPLVMADETVVNLRYKRR